MGNIRLRRALGFSLFLLLLASHASAQPTTIPKKVQISDPASDGNYLNTQWLWYYGAPESGDVTTPADASSAGDILKVWFTNDRKTVSAHIQVEGVQAESTDIQYFLSFNHRCFILTGILDGTLDTYSAEHGWFHDCDDRYVASKTTFTTLRDKTGLVTITVNRSLMPPVIKQPQVTSEHVTDLSGNAHWTTIAVIDSTKRGSNYKIK